MRQKISIILIFLLSAFGTSGQDNKGAYSLLWEISGKGLNKPSYLFGTMHLRDSRVFEFSDSVLAKLDLCEGFAIEIHPDSLVGGKFSYMYYDQKGIPVSTIIHDSSSFGIEELKYHTPYIVRSFYERSRRWDLDKPVFLDAYLFNLAKKQGKTTLAVESIEEHVNLADRLGAIDIGLKFKFKFNFFSNNDESDDYIDVYRSGNIYKLDSFMRRSWYNKASLFNMLDKRNFSMAKRADSLIRIRPTFIAVGAAHLPGENGLISLLKKRGYTLRRVPATFTNFRDSYVLKEKNIPWYELRQDHYGYSIQVPGIIYAGSEQPDTFKLHTFVDTGNNLVYNTFCINYDRYRDSVKGPALIRKIIISALESEGEPEQNYRESLKKKSSASEKIRNKVVRVKEVTQNGVMGKDVIIKCSDSLFLRMQIFDLDHRIYVNRLKLPEEMLESSASERFFNSFKVYTPKPYKTIKPVEYKNSHGAYSINFSNPPLRNQITYYKKPADTLTENYTEYYLITANIPERTFAYMMYSDNELSYGARTDSAILDHLMDEHGRSYGYKIGKEISLNEKGIAGLEQNYRDWDDTKVKVRCYIRGTRHYVVVEKYKSDSDKDSVDKRPFLDSFGFIPLKNQKLQPFNFKNEGLTMLLPSAPFISADTLKIVSVKRYNNDDEEYYEEYDYENSYYSRNNNFPLTGKREGIDLEKHFESSDKNNGSTFRMNIQHFSKYYRAENIDSLYKDRLNSFKRKGDSIRYEKNFTIGNFKGKELGFYTDSISYDYRLRMLLAGDQLYTWTARTPKELSGLGHLDAFMESIDIKPAKNAGDIFSSKASVMLSDLSSSDSITALNAFVGLKQYDFHKNEYPAIYRALRKSYADDTLEYGSKRSMMLYALRDSCDENTVSFLDSLYPGLSAHPWLQANLLAVLAKAASQTSLNSFFSILKTGTPAISSSSYRVSHIFYPFYTSPEAVKSRFETFSKFLEADNKYVAAEVSNLLRIVVFKDSMPDKSLINNSKKHFIRCLQKTLEAYRDAPDSLKTEYAGTLENISSMLYLASPDAEVNDIIEKLIRSNDLETRLNANLALIAYGRKVNIKTLSNMLKANNYLAYQFVRNVNSVGKMNMLPKEFYSQRKVAELAVWNHFFEESDEIPDSVIFFKEKIITHQDEKIRIYVFKCSYEYNEEDYFLAISGPQPMDTKKFKFDDSFTASDWKSWNAKNSEERIDELIDGQIKNISERKTKVKDIR